MGASRVEVRCITVPPEKLRRQLSQFVDAQLAGLGAGGEGR
jgi:hypothetical protein